MIHTLMKRPTAQLPSASLRSTDSRLMKELLANNAQLVGTAIVLRDNAVGLQSRLCRGAYTTASEVRHTLRAAATVVAAIRVAKVCHTDALRAADDLTSFLRGEPVTLAIAKLAAEASR